MKTRTAILGALASALLPALIATAAARSIGVLDSVQTMSGSGYGVSLLELDHNAALQAQADRLWWGQEFARLWREVDAPSCENRVQDGDPERILSILDRLPPPILATIHDSGVRVILHEGHFAEQEECADVRGDPDYENTVGFYRHHSNLAFVQTDRPLWKVRHTLLHELAHALELHGGEFADGEEFGRVYAADDAIADLGYPETVEEPKRPGEYFAESFADWFISPGRRQWMRECRPAAARYLAELESRLTIRHYERVERETGRSELRRLRERRHVLAASQR